MTNPETAPASEAADRPAPPVPHPAPSPRQRIVLALAGTVFLVWLGYLAFLAVATSHPVVLSQPQLLVSNLIVIAQLTGGADHPDSTAILENVVWSGDPAPPAPAKARITVKNLESVSPDRGWIGPGEYILALTRQADGTLRVTPIPRSPGYPANAAQQADRVRIYPANGSARQQLAEIERQFHRQ